jgi:hypothetical protein
MRRRKRGTGSLGRERARSRSLSSCGMRRCTRERYVNRHPDLPGALTDTSLVDFNDGYVDLIDDGRNVAY